MGFEGVTPETAKELLDDALDAGLNIIDTAAAYLKSEELIGQAVSGRRDDFYLCTKCGAYDGFTKQDWSVPGILRTIEQSLKRLNTDYVDLIQLHSCSEEELRKGDPIDALRQAHAKGYARYIGYSGDGAAARYAVESGAFDTLQSSISVADQEALDKTLPLAREKGMGVIAKRPVANAVWRYDERPQNDYHVAYWERIQKLDYDFLKNSLPDSVSVALRFTLSQPGVHTAIVGTTKPGRWRENAAMLEKGPLSPKEIEKIRARWREVGGDSWGAET